MKKRLWNNEQGEIMIESMLVMIPILFVLVFLLSLGFLLYQQWNIQYVADEIANKVSMTYPYLESHTASGVVTWEQMKKKELYRYLFGMSQYETKSEIRGQEYGESLLEKTTFASPQTKETITIKTEKDSLARRHVYVKVKGKYKIPFGEGLEIFGMNSIRTYTSESTAECVDLMDYVGTITYGKNCLSLITGDASAIIDMIDSWLKVFKHIE